MGRKGTYISGLGLDSSNTKRTFLLFHLVTVLSVDILQAPRKLADAVPPCQKKQTHGSLDLGLQSTGCKLVHRGSDFT
jgi:hypothetical protein